MKECQIYHQYFRCFSRKLQLPFLSPPNDWLVWPSDKVFSGSENHNSSSSTAMSEVFWKFVYCVTTRMASSSFALGFISQTKQDAFELDCGQFLVGGFSGCYWLKEAVVVAKGGEKRWKRWKRGEMVTDFQTSAVANYQNYAVSFLLGLFGV